MTCGGSGEIAGAVCNNCQGQGAVIRPKRIEVKIPAGAKDGTRITGNLDFDAPSPAAQQEPEP